MDLHRRLKQARARPKEPFRRSAFTVAGALVREHNLDESFPERLWEVAAQGTEWVRSYEPQPKSPFKPPLFVLAAAQEFRLIQAILAAADSPYLPFAHSPDELLASGPLFLLNPDLSPSILAQIHFRVLLAREIVQAELQESQRRLENSADFQEMQGAFERLLNRLNEFIDHAT